jgi:integrase/recombinase XerD
VEAMTEAYSHGHATIPIKARNPKARNHRIESVPLNVASDWKSFWFAADQQLRSCGFTRTSRLFYRQVLRLFVSHTHKPPDAITADDVKVYLRKLAGQRPSWHWTAMSISVLRTLFDKLAGLHALDHQRGPLRKRKIPSVLTRDDVTRLITSATCLRDQLILGLLYGCGLRIAELTGLRWRDIDLQTNTIRLQSRYTGKPRMVRLPENLLSLLRMGQKQSPPDDYILAGVKKSKPMTTRSVQRMIRRTAQQAGFDQPVTAFHLRNTFAVHFLEQGGNIRELQTALGLENLQAAMRYQVLVETGHEPVQPVEVDLSADWEVLTAPPLPTTSGDFTFLDILRTHLRGRFLAVRTFFNTA